jgi:type IV pilus assembly protein PilC
MESFEFRVQLPDGSLKEGLVEAVDKTDALKKAKSKAEGGKVVRVIKEGSFNLEDFFDSKNKRITQQDIFLFTKYFGVLLKAGVPVVRCMKILEDQMPNKRVKKMVGKMCDNIEGGSSVYEAFSKFPEHFGSMYINLIKTGEESGLLFDIFIRLTENIQKSLKLKSKVKGAMVYPAVIMFVAGIVITFLLVFIVPRFGEIFAKMGGTLPLPTRILLNFSTGLKIAVIPLVILGFIMLKLFKKFTSTPYGREMVDNLTLKIPMFGELTRKYNVTAFCTNLSMLLRSGVSITKALGVVGDSVENVIIRDTILASAKNIESGQSIADAFKNNETFPDLAKQMISVGDETGNLEDMLQNVSEFYEEEVENLIEGLTAMIEPLFILFLGATVGFIVVSMFLPMFAMGKMVQHA